MLKKTRNDTKAPETAALKVAQVAQSLQVSSRTVYKLIEAGDLEIIRVGRLFRVPRRSLDAFLNRRPRPAKRASRSDERLSPSDIKAVRDGLAAIQRGETIALGDLRRKYGV